MVPSKSCQSREEISQLGVETPYFVYLARESCHIASRNGAGDGFGDRSSRHGLLHRAAGKLEIPGDDLGPQAHLIG